MTDKKVIKCNLGFCRIMVQFGELSYYVKTIGYTSDDLQ